MSILLCENDIPGSSLAGRNPVELKTEELHFWLKCSDDPAKGPWRAAICEYGVWSFFLALKF